MDIVEIWLVTDSQDINIRDMYESTPPTLIIFREDYLKLYPYFKNRYRDWYCDGDTEFIKHLKELAIKYELHQEVIKG